MIETENDDNIWPGYNEQLLRLTKKNLAASNEFKFFYLKHQAGALNNFGFLMNQKGNISKALEYYKRSLKIQEEIHDKPGIATVLNNMAFIYSYQGDATLALDYYHKSLKIQEEIKNKKGIAIALNNLGLFYEQQGYRGKAKEYYINSLKIRKEIKDKLGTTSCLINIASITISFGDTANAIKYLEDCINIQTEMNDKIGMASSLNNLGAIYLWSGKYQLALEYTFKSLEISESFEDIDDMVFSYNNVSKIYVEMGNLNKAFLYANKSFILSQKLGFPGNITRSANTLKTIFQKQNKYKEALEMLEVEIKMRDSITNQNTQKAAIKKQMQYSYEKKELETKAEQDKKDVIAKAELIQKENERNYFIAGFSLVLILALFILRGYKQKQKANAIILEQKHLVDEKQKEILDSIHYAKRIQTALLPSEKYIHKNFKQLNKNL
ncbi:MAG: tetratricopeptide repeat protein [Bacteroidota bacterium]|nr:tetratricopeptide repeat protein [Bacteroidota bacterium]